VFHGVAGGILTGGFLGGEEGFDGAEWLVFSFDGEEAGEALPGLIVGVGWLGGGGGALEFCWIC
jgi:hypothetical protein